MDIMMTMFDDSLQEGESFFLDLDILDLFLVNGDLYVKVSDNYGYSFKVNDDIYFPHSNNSKVERLDTPLWLIAAQDMLYVWNNSEMGKLSATLTNWTIQMCVEHLKMAQKLKDLEETND